MASNRLLIPSIRGLWAKLMALLRMALSLKEIGDDGV